MKYILMALMSMSSFASADAMSDLCQNVASNYVSGQFRMQYDTPQVYVDAAMASDANIYPHYSFQFYLSGRSLGRWTHQTWRVETSSARGGCGVVKAEKVSETFDR